MYQGFRSLEISGEVECLRERGAREPEKHMDGFRMAWSVSDLLADEATPGKAKLLFPAKGQSVKMLEGVDCLLNGIFALVPQDQMPELYHRAMTEGVAI